MVKVPRHQQSGTEEKEKPMTIWQHILTPTGASLGPGDILMIILGTFVALSGTALIVVPKEVASWHRTRSLFSTDGKQQVRGKWERELRAELRVTVGMGMVMWSIAWILSFLLHLIGTYGLETYLLSALVLLALPVLVGYVTVYRFMLYPGYLAVCRRLDTRTTYEPAGKKKKSQKALSDMPGKEKIGLLPGKALIGIVAAALLYYVPMAFVAIPPSLPPPNHDHLLHQFGTVVMSIVGYTIGLVASLGDDIRPFSSLLRLSKK